MTDQLPDLHLLIAQERAKTTNVVPLPAASSPPEAAVGPSDGPDFPESIGANLVDWEAFWAKDHHEAEWVAEPIIALSRGHSIYAVGGMGKSLLSLWLAAAIATGQPIFGQVGPPLRVLYLDYEMTEADLYERLEAMGYGPETDLSRLHYALLPSLPPLDTAEGGNRLRLLAAHVQADVVVIDTYGRAVEGDENDADTTRAFYRHAGMLLKADGRTWLRIDHAGKDAAKGQRGSSAKNDDVDVVWQMSATDTGYQLKATKRRMGWVPDTVDIVKHDEPDLHYTLASAPVAPVGTLDAVALLDRLDVPVTASQRAAGKMIREAGHKVRNNALRAALKFRLDRSAGLFGPVDTCGKTRPNALGAPHDDTDGAHHGAQLGAFDKTPGQDVGRAVGRAGAHLAGPTAPASATRRGARGQGAPAEEPLTEPLTDPDDLF